MLLNELVTFVNNRRFQLLENEHCIKQLPVLGMEPNSKSRITSSKEPASALIISTPSKNELLGFTNERAKNNRFLGHHSTLLSQKLRTVVLNVRSGYLILFQQRLLYVRNLGTLGVFFFFTTMVTNPKNHPDTRWGVGVVCNTTVPPALAEVPKIGPQ
jgi:hypothetical protein